MKKSLIALAVVGAFTAQAAMAEATIYGQANVSYDAISNGANGNSQSANTVSSNVSRLGFKGSEDLGDGLSAIWQIEQSINFDQANNSPTALGTNAAPTTAAAGNTFATRDTFAGLSSASMGTVIAGIHDTPYKMATRGYDLFADTVADNRSIMGQSGGTSHDARLSNVVAYISPAFSGVTLAVATVAGAEIPGANVTKGSAWSLAALYGAGPISASLAYQTVTIGSASTGTLGLNANNGGLNLTNAALAANDKLNAFKLGGSYTMDAFQINAAIEKIGSTLAASPSNDALRRTSFYLGGKFNVNANDAVKAAYTKGANVGGVTNTGVKQFSVGYDHNLSKHTTVYALYSKLTNDTTANYTFSQSTSATAANGGANSAPSVVSLGMKHAF